MTRYITTTIPYVNADPHIGHALEFVQADAIARAWRAKGDDVFFLSGTDENAIKNVHAAEEAGVPINKFVDTKAKIFANLLHELNISVDQFIRTTEERHFVGATKLWKVAEEKGDIYKKTYSGLYCVGCEAFYLPDELDDNGECHEHPGRKLDEVEEENYFFKLSNYEKWLLELISGDKLQLVPEKRKNEVTSFISRGLEDFSISRPKERSGGWGVPVPGDDSQTMYVWFDALSNYITALGYPDTKSELYRNFWSNSSTRLHTLGKGVSRFHAIYWPAMLKSAGLPIPNEELIHGYITIDGQKMSKTLGNVINPSELIKKYGADTVRYYLLREIPTLDDGDFSMEKLEGRYNADLANGLGNFISRSLALVQGINAEKMRSDDFSNTNKEVGNVIRDTNISVEKKIENYKLNEALGHVWELIAYGDGYVNAKEPWKMEEGEEKNEFMKNLLAIVSSVSSALTPFMPETSEKINKALAGEKIGQLFPRLPAAG